MITAKKLLPLLCCLLYISACTSTVSGESTTRKEDFSQVNLPLAAKDLLGEYSTVDYCSLLDFGQLVAAGATFLSRSFPSFDSCSINIEIVKQPATIELGYIDSSGVTTRQGNIHEKSLLPHGMSVDRKQHTIAGACHHYLIFADGMSLRSGTMSDPATEIPTEALCNISRAAIKGAVAATAEKRVLHLDFAKNSWGTVDTCTLFSAEEAATILGRTSVSTTAFPSRHRCRWWDEQSSAALEISLFLGSPRKISTDSWSEKIARQTSQLQLAEDRCTIFTLHSSSDWQQADSAEIAGVTAWAGMSAEKACDLAKAVATTVWPLLLTPT